MASRTVYHDQTKSTLYPNGDLKKGGHRNWRNNNPGNITYGDYAKRNGAIGTDGRFAVFNSMEEGYQAQATLLQSTNYKDLTLNDAIYRYAPPSENDSAGYVRYIADKTGISANKTMSDMTPEEMDSIVKNMARHEGMKSGDLIAGATIDGNQATGGTKIEDPDATWNGGGDPSYASYPPCAPGQTPEAGATKKIAQTEGDGQYADGDISTMFFDGPSGRYKLDQATAIGLMIELGRVTTVQKGEELWEKCRSSTHGDCQRLQDDLADRFVTKLRSGLKDNRYINLYLRWKIGPTTSESILTTHKESGLVTDSIRVKLMDDQPWCQAQPSNGNTNIFFSNLEKYITNHGVDPIARV